METDGRPVSSSIISAPSNSASKIDAEEVIPSSDSFQEILDSAGGVTLMSLDANEFGDGGGEVEGSSSSPEEEEDADNDHSLRLENGLTPLDLMEDDTPAFDLFEQLERSNYDVLADRKRKEIVAMYCEGSKKKARQDDVPGASCDEILEVMSYSAPKRSRKIKKKGRRSGTKNKLSLKVMQMIGDANLHYAHGLYTEAIQILKEVICISPKFMPEAFHTLGLVYSVKGDDSRALKFYLLAAYSSRQYSPLWSLLITKSIEQGEIDLAWHCLCYAIKADPKDMTLRSLCASLSVELGDYQKAAESYIQISRTCQDVEALKMASKLLLKSGKTEHSISILEDYLSDCPADRDLTVVDLLAAIYIENNAHDKALQLIEHVPAVNSCMKELPISLMVKASICHVYLGNMEKAEFLFSICSQQSPFDQADLVKVADSYMTQGHYESALKYYLMLDGKEDSVGILKGYLHLKIGNCYISLKEQAKAIPFLYRALQTLEDDTDVRLTLASIILQEANDDEAIALLSPPNGSESVSHPNPDGSQPWWLDGEVRLSLSKIYLAKQQLEDFVDVIFIPVYDSLVFETNRQKIKKAKKTPKSTLIERAKILNDHHHRDYLFPIRPLATQSDLSKAARARRSLQKMEMLRKEQKAAALAAGVEWLSDDSDEEPPRELSRCPLPNLLKDEEHWHIIIDLSEALVSLQRYQDAFKIINAALKLPHDLELESLGARIACKAKPEQCFSFLKRIVKAHPYSIAAWNCYYDVISRNEYHNQRHSSFLHKIQEKCKDWVPPMLISGHRYTMLSQHQAAAREYLRAYRVMPESPLINLCVGTSLINLALGFRLQNKHQCVAQGLAFLYNNLRLCESSQESLFNIARAYHHVGLVSLAVSYYEKVLATHEKDHDVPELPDQIQRSKECWKSGYCHLRREAAYNLHLIYKKSGAFDLAREVLKTHCTM